MLVGRPPTGCRVESAVAKYVQGTSAAIENTGYGIPSEGMPASRPKKMVNTTIVRTGWRIAQPAPSAVCL